MNCTRELGHGEALQFATPLEGTGSASGGSESFSSKRDRWLTDRAISETLALTHPKYTGPLLEVGASFVYEACSARGGR